MGPNNNNGLPMSANPPPASMAPAAFSPPTVAPTATPAPAVPPVQTPSQPTATQSPSSPALTSTSSVPTITPPPLCGGDCDSNWQTLNRDLGQPIPLERQRDAFDPPASPPVAPQPETEENIQDREPKAVDRHRIDEGKKAVGAESLTQKQLNSALINPSTKGGN